jgi:type I restriction enzyme S subunit
MSWPVFTIGDLCEVIAGQSPKGTAYNSNGKGLPFYQGKKEFREKYLGAPSTWTTEITKEALAGDILMSVRAPVGPINFSTENICIGRGLAAIRASSNINRDFLFYFLLSKKPEIKGSEGAVFSSINKKQISDIYIPVPSLPEQKRIVAILDEAFEGIDAAIANTQANLAAARELFESYLDRVFSGKGDNWEEKRLEDYCKRITVGHVGSMSKRYQQNGVPFLRSQNILPFKVSLKNVKYIDVKFNTELKKSQLNPGDVAIVRTGYPGTAAVIPADLEISNCSDLVIAKTKKELNSHFLTLILNSSFGKKLVGQNLVGTAQKHFNVTAAKNVKIAVPELQTQEKIIDKATSISFETQRLETLYQQKLTALHELQQSILAKAFRGELTQNEVAA